MENICHSFKRHARVFVYIFLMRYSIYNDTHTHTHAHKQTKKSGYNG